MPTRPGSTCQRQSESPQFSPVLKFPISGPISSERRSQIPHLRGWRDQGAGGHAEDAGTLLVFEAIALTADVDRGRVVEETVDDGGGGNFVAENRTPLGIGLVPGDDDAALGVTLGDELEQEAGGDLV